MLKRIKKDRELEELNEHDDAALDKLKTRLLAIAGIILFFGGLIVLRLWFLQIHKGEEYRMRAENNRVRISQTPPPRGSILDRKGREIVSNRPSFNILLVREDSGDIEELLKKLSRVLDMSVSELWKQIKDNAHKPRHIPIRLKEDIDWETLAFLENHNQEFPGVRIEVLPVRTYGWGDLAANVIGYVKQISKKELEERDEERYRGGDLIGKKGLERLKEEELRGEKGNRLSEVDHRGFEQQVLQDVDPLPGNEITLTIDAELQQVAEEIMDKEGKAGAVVAMEVNTGRVLVAASTPRIHLEDFIGRISEKKWKQYNDNPKHPLINKVVQAAYPPGSTYKMVTALAGLALGVIDKDTALYCPGHYKFAGRRYHCWKRGGHGAVNLKRAIAESCDVYFYQVGLRVGVDNLARFAKKYGLGKKTGVDLEYEKSGIVPTKEWKKKARGQKWQEGETLSVAIGQGFNLTTPLQICLMTATIANGGKQYLPQLIEFIKEPDGTIKEQFEPKLIDELKGEKRYLKQIRRGMFEVVQGKRGTARRARIKGITIGGKTGTAQVVRLAQYRHLKEEDIPYKFRDHAWFTCYAPADKPEIAVTVLVEHGLHGSSGAAPVAKLVLEKYFEKHLEKLAAEGDHVSNR